MNGNSVVLSGQSLTAEDFYSEIISLEKTLARLKEKFLKWEKVFFWTKTNDEGLGKK